MATTEVTKVNASRAPVGQQGERTLAKGALLSMRLWEDEAPGESKPETTREYETVGYVLKGRAELWLNGSCCTLTAGDSYLVPARTKHRYRILEEFSAVETTSRSETTPAARH